MVDQGSPPPNKTRGGAKLECLKRIKPETKVAYEHIDGVPVGSNASKLSAFIGKLAKDGHYFPFDMRSWTHISELATKIETAKDEMKVI
ncbi:uncharacterized protein M6B38_306645 [Iris pallida]|uniref:Uncharacterized protein n=1 Tax=Iris pallida TaxID=29817 RepID=A0AAX6G2V9_IRIPA|nr:uncharacterized protein M6B38_387565 [Iris pallida]KAJ6841542.1 uncharacterized protein M6B38_306645 [Iris pallida]